jgi:dCTP deaminase
MGSSARRAPPPQAAAAGHHLVAARAAPMSAGSSLFPELADARSADDLEHSTGVLPSQRLRWLIDAGHLCASEPIGDDQIQPASVDLRLGPVAYRVRASFLPNRATVRKRLEDLAAHVLDLTQPAVLERGCVYIVPLLEELNLPPGYWAKANPKSTTGRLDVFTRLVTDFGNRFDHVDDGYRGRLYLEIAPQTFSVAVSQGTRLSQLRFWRGKPLPSDTALTQLHEAQALVYTAADEPLDAVIAKGLWLSVDLASGSIVGYRAKRHAPVVDLRRIGYYDPAEFWDPLGADGRRSLILEPDEFYILVSRERISVPPGFAAEMMGYEPALGEFRVHYAGFFDPGFGYALSEVRGTHAVLEVRSHQVPYVLEDGQRVARLIFERLLGVPDRLYGPGIGSSYQFQGLSLSKHFRPFRADEQR